MSIGKDLRAVTATSVINSVSCANTAAATSGWFDVRNAKGDILFIQDSGAITGTLAGKIQGATDDQGTGVADISGATFTSVSAANKTYKCIIKRGAAPYVRYLGTVGTGPVLLSVTMLSRVGESAQ